MSTLGRIIGLAMLAVTMFNAVDGVAGDRSIDLSGGGRVVLRADGTMVHFNAAGNPVAMREDEIMVTKDGSRIVMKNRTLWREVLELTAQAVGAASVIPFVRIDAGERVVDLADGGRITVRGDGTMLHYGPRGNRVDMADGQMMVAKDGTRVLMKNGNLWSATPSRDPAKGAQ